MEFIGKEVSSQCRIFSIGSLKLVEWARDNRFFWNRNNISSIAAKNGHLELLKWARENGCPWDKDSCGLVAVQRGYLEMVKWSRENG